MMDVNLLYIPAGAAAAVLGWIIKWVWDIATARAKDATNIGDLTRRVDEIKAKLDGFHGAPCARLEQVADSLSTYREFAAREYAGHEALASFRGEIMGAINALSQRFDRYMERERAAG